MPSDELVARRRKVMELADMGMSNRDIAMELGISASTVSSDKRAYHDRPDDYMPVVPAEKTEKTDDASVPNDAGTDGDNVSIDGNGEPSQRDASDGERDEDDAADVRRESTDMSTPEPESDASVNADTPADGERHDSNADNADGSDGSEPEEPEPEPAGKATDDISRTMDERIHEFQSRLHDIAVDAREQMGLPKEDAPEYGDEQESVGSEAGDARDDRMLASRSVSQLHPASGNGASDAANGSGIMVKHDESHGLGIMGKLVGGNDGHARDAFMTLTENEKWDVKEHEKGTAFVNGVITGSIVIAVMSLLLNIVL